MARRRRRILCGRRRPIVSSWRLIPLRCSSTSWTRFASSPRTLPRSVQYRYESIGTLAAGVAHDLNNILSPILLVSPLLRTDLAAEDKETFLSLVQTSAERGANLVKQMLTFARGADGERVLVQPSYLLEEVAKIAGQTFPKSITLRTKYPQDLWMIEGDPTQLQQVLLNLCVNARDAMPEGGCLRLTSENFQVDEHYASMTAGAQTGPHVLIQVSDDAAGIPRHVIDKIFDPFFTTKEIGQGTGLGLSTVIGIVKSYGGFVNVHSEPGHTSFKVFLPANNALAQQGEKRFRSRPVMARKFWWSMTNPPSAPPRRRCSKGAATRRSSRRTASARSPSMPDAIRSRPDRSGHAVDGRRHSHSGAAQAESPIEDRGLNRARRRGAVARPTLVRHRHLSLETAFPRKITPHPRRRLARALREWNGRFVRLIGDSVGIRQPFPKKP